MVWIDKYELGGANYHPKPMNEFVEEIGIMKKISMYMKLFFIDKTKGIFGI